MSTPVQQNKPLPFIATEKVGIWNCIEKSDDISNCSIDGGFVCHLAEESNPIFSGDIITEQNSDVYIEHGHLQPKSMLFEITLV